MDNAKIIKRFLQWITTVKKQEKSFTLLSGKWGSGKTKLNIKICEESKSFWRFDVRQYNYNDSIIYPFLLVLAERYGINVSDARISSFIHNSYPEDEKTMIKQLQKALTKNDDVVFIDELDRINPYKALEIIEWVTNTFVDSKVTFVFSIYENALKDIIASEVGYCTPEEYIEDKIDAVFYIDDDISKMMLELKDELSIKDYIWSPLKKDYIDNFSERTLNYLRDDITNSIRINDTLDIEVFYNLLFMVKVSTKSFSVNAVEHYAEDDFTIKNSEWKDKIDKLFELENKVYVDYAKVITRHSLGNSIDLVVNENHMNDYVKFIEKLNKVDFEIEAINDSKQEEINKFKLVRDARIEKIKKQPGVLRAKVNSTKSNIDYVEKKLASIDKRINNKSSQGLNATKILSFMKSSTSYKKEYNDLLDSLAEFKKELKHNTNAVNNFDLDSILNKAITEANKEEQRIMDKHQVDIDKKQVLKNKIISELEVFNKNDIITTVTEAQNIYKDAKLLFNPNFKINTKGKLDQASINVMIDEIHEEHVIQKQKYLSACEKYKKTLVSLYNEMLHDEYILIK